MKQIEDVEKLHREIPRIPGEFEMFCRDMFDGYFNLYVGNVTLHDDIGFETEKGRMGYCSKCRSWFKAPKEMKAGKEYACTCCSNYGTVFSANKKFMPTEHYQTVWLGQRMPDKVFVLRGFRVKLLQWSPMVISRDDQTDVLEMIETRRLYIAPDAFYKEYTSWHMQPDGQWKLDWGKTAGLNTNCDGPVFPETVYEAKGTAAEYAFIQMAEENGLFRDGQNINNNWCPQAWYRQYSLWDYLSIYAKDRKIEMLLKLGMEELITRRMQGMSINYNWRAKNPWDYLNIYKSRLKDLKQRDNLGAYLDIYQTERKSGQHFTEEELEVLRLTYSNKRQLERALQFMSMKQLSNRVKKYQERTKDSFQGTLNTYLDYLFMKEELGFDMTKSIYQFPKDLKRAHKRCLDDKFHREEAERIKKAAEKYENIEKRFKKAKIIYTFMSEGLIIRPAKNAGEIIMEGRILHHCVGGDNYLSSHDSGRDIILFLRKEEEPEKPYVTVELDPDGKIKQWYGACDKKPDKRRNDKWLNDYVKGLDTNKVKKEMRKYQKAKGVTA